MYSKSPDIIGQMGTLPVKEESLTILELCKYCPRIRDSLKRVLSLRTKKKPALELSDSFGTKRR